jgi:predicted flap endonuclease-1-like 5' DNA nuclease
MTAIVDLEGIGPEYERKLHEAGVRSTAGLLKRAGSRAGREELAAALGVSTGRVLEWVNRADLIRVRGIGSEYSDLLEAAGVDSTVELAKRRSGNLHAKLVEVNAAKKLVRQLPTRQAVERWIAEARALPRVVTH